MKTRRSSHGGKLSLADEANTTRQAEKIEKLSSATSALIRASSTFPTFSSIVLELLRNAVASRNVTSVDIEVAFAPEWQIRCEDDGLGFNEEVWPGMTWHKVFDRAPQSSTPDVYSSANSFFNCPHTSRQSLSKLAHLGVLDVTTNVEGSNERSRLLVQDNDIIFCGPHHSETTKLRRGSTIILRDLFAKVSGG